MRLNYDQLKAFIAACVNDGRPEARALAVTAFERFQRRYPN